jgi:hypothetical protein
LITENLSTLKIHKLTQAQYERELVAGNIDANALYLTPDEATNIEIDTTLTQSGMAADAKTVGDAIALKANKLDLVQPNWLQTDASALDYIKNKPEITSSENLDLFYDAIIRGSANPEEPLNIVTYDGGQN